MNRTTTKSRYKYNLRLLAYSIAAASAVTVTEVSAQNRSTEATMIDEVIVTARRREESLQDVPISISALDAQFIERAAITQHEDLQYYVPSFNAITAGARKDTLALSLRGQSNGDVLGVSDPAVATYFGDALISRPIGTNQALFDLESVQVLLGVQGTLFGRNTTGGALVITPAAPKDEFEALVKASYGNFDRQELEGMINVPLGEAAALRVSGKTLDRDGTFENIETGQELDSKNLEAFRVSLRLNPTESIESTTIYDYYEHDQDSNALSMWAYNPTAGTVLGMANLRNQAANFPFFERLQQIPDPAVLLAEQRALGPYKVRSEVGSGIPGVDIYGGLDSKAENWGVQNVTQIDFDSFSIKNILAYRELEIDTTVDLDGSLNGGIASHQTGSAEFWSEELQILGTALDGKFDWLVGFYFLSEDGVDDSSSMQFNDLRIEGTRLAVYNGRINAGATQEAAIAAANAAAANAAVRAHTSGLWENQSTAIYTGLSYRFTEHWTLSGGLRYTEDERDSTPTHRTVNLATGVATCQFVDASRTPLPMSECGPTVSDSWDAITYDGTLTYNFSDDTMMYGAHRHGYKTGGFGGRARDAFAQTPFDEEVVDEYELGFKSDFTLGNAAGRLNGALFYQDYQDIQVQTARDFGQMVVTIINNAADATIQGGELELLLLPTDRLQLNLFYSYTDGEYDTFMDGGEDRTDEWLIEAPDHMYGGTLTYTIPLEETSELVFTLNAYGQSKAHLDDVDIVSDQDAYELYNARMSWERIGGSGFSAALWGRNLSDEEYGVGTVSILDTSAGSSGRIWGDPRTYGLEVSYRFQ